VSFNLLDLAQRFDQVAARKVNGAKRIASIACSRIGQKEKSVPSQVNEMRLSRGGSVAGRCQRYLTAAGSNRTLERQDETSNESRLMRTPASDRQTA